MSTPETDEAARVRVRLPMMATAALVSAGLAPLVDELFFPRFTEPRMSPLTLLYGLGAAALAALYAGVVVHLALRRKSPLHVLWIATIAGILHPPLLAAHMVFEAENPLYAVVGMTLLGAVVSAPVGFAFGVVFLAGLWAPSRTGLAIARMFAAAGAIALLLSIPLGGSYCQLVFFVLLPALGLEAPPGTDIEWTRLLVVPGPFALTSLTAFLLARREAARANVALEAPASAAPAPDAEV